MPSAFHLRFQSRRIANSTDLSLYLIFGEREIWLVDSGVAGSDDPIALYLGQLGRELAEVLTVTLTHSHPDHIGAASAIQKSTGCDILIHETERAWVEDVELQRRERPVPGFDRLIGGSAVVTRAIAGGDRLELDNGLSIEVIHTPGHSVGSVSLWLESERVLISGDAVISAGDFPIDDDYRQTAESIERLAALRGVEVLLSSWGVPMRGAAIGERFREGIDYLRRIEQVDRQMAAGEERLDPMGLCREVVETLELPPVAVNPLVARALMSHLRG